MRKTNKMKKITVAMGLALAMSVGAGVGAKTALATTISGGTPAYLSTPELSTAPISGGFSFQTSATGSNTYYASSTSLYGNTIPTVSELGSLTGLSAANFDSQSITDTNPTVFYSPSSLNLTQIATQTQAFQLGSSSGGGTEVTGNVISDVFQIGSASPTMAGAVPGDLVFTYQFDVTGVVSNNNSGVFSATVTAFNDPNGTAYTLGSGINTSSIGTAFGSTLPAITQYNPDNNPLNTLTTFNGLANLNGIVGTVDYSANGTVSNLNYATTGGVPVGDYSPQFFIATTAMYYGSGTIGLDGSGVSGLDVPVFVPNTPEPGTLVLFGTGIALLGFMVLRKKMNTLAI